MYYNTYEKTSAELVTELLRFVGVRGLKIEGAEVSPRVPSSCVLPSLKSVDAALIYFYNFITASIKNETDLNTTQMLWSLP